MSNDLHDVFKKELDQIPLRPPETWTDETRRRRISGGIAGRTPVAIGGAVVVLIAALIGGRQLASFHERMAGEPGVVAGKAVYLSPSFNGSGWIQIDPVTLRDVTGTPLMQISPTITNNNDTVISADGSRIIVGEFTATGARRAMYDGATGQLRGYLTPEVPMAIDYLSADGRTALGRLGTTASALTDPKAIISTETGRVIRTIAAGPALWTHGVIVAPDLSAIYYVVTRVPLSETSLDVSVQQPLSLIVQNTIDGKLSAPIALPGMTFGNLLNATPPQSVGTSMALSPNGRQLAFLSYDGSTLDLVDTGSLAMTNRSVHRKTSLFDRLGLVAEAKELIDQQWTDTRFTPDGEALLVVTTNIHYGAESPTRTTRGIRRIDLATAEITADVAQSGGIYSTLISPDGAALYLVVRSQEPPSAAYVLRRLDARTLELKAERALPDYAELKLVAAPAPHSARPSPTLPTATDPSISCSHERLVYLVEQFYARYNAHYSADLLQLFRFGVPAAGGGSVDYFDDPGVPVHLTDAGRLLTYWENRFAQGDRFGVWVASYPPEGATRFTGNATVAFTRSFDGGMQEGNMQLDCDAGLLVAVRMSSDYGGWGSREAFRVRFSVPSAWKGPEDIDTQKTGGFKNWLVFTDASGSTQVTVWLIDGSSAETFASTRLTAVGSERKTVTISDAGQTRTVIEVHAPAYWSGPTGAGSYDNRHLVIQLTPTLVADVIVSAPQINGPSKLTAEQILVQDRMTVRIAAVN